MIQASSSATALVSAVEEFVHAADAFLQNHYMVGSDSEDISKILKAFHNLNLDINIEQLEQEFDIQLEKKTQMADYYDSAWF